MDQPPTPRGPRRRLAPIPYALLFVALVAAASTFVWRDFHSSVAVAVDAIERDAGLVAELSTPTDGSMDSGPIAAFAPRHLERAWVDGSSSWTPPAACSTRPGALPTAPRRPH